MIITPKQATLAREFASMCGAGMFDVRKTGAFARMICNAGNARKLSVSEIILGTLTALDYLSDNLVGNITNETPQDIKNGLAMFLFLQLTNNAEADKMVSELHAAYCVTEDFQPEGTA